MTKWREIIFNSLRLYRNKSVACATQAGSSFISLCFTFSNVLNAVAGLNHANTLNCYQKR